MPQDQSNPTTEASLRAYNPLKGDRALDRPSGFYEPPKDPLDFLSKLLTGLDTPGVTQSSVDSGALAKLIRGLLRGAARNDLQIERDVLPLVERQAKWLNRELRDVGGSNPVPVSRLASGGEASVFNLEGLESVLKLFPYGMPEYLQRTLTFPPPQLAPIQKWGATATKNKAGYPYGYVVQEKGTPLMSKSVYDSLSKEEYLAERKKTLDFVNSLGEDLAKYGFQLSDPSPTNIGFNRAGKPAVLDIGAIIDSKKPVYFRPFVD